MSGTATTTTTTDTKIAPATTLNMTSLPVVPAGSARPRQAAAPDGRDRAGGSWTGLYGDFILKNASAVSQIESALRSLMYLVPGRFKESEVATETIHSGVQLLSMYHDSVLARAVDRMPVLERPHGSPHSRYTKFWSSKSGAYRRLAFIIQVIQYTELLWEMLAKRRSDKTRWTVVTMLETIKAICRLVLMKLTKSRILLSPPLPEREIDPAKLEESTRRAGLGSSSAIGSNGRSRSSSSTTLQDGDEQNKRADDQDDHEDGYETDFGDSDSTLSDQTWRMPRTGLRVPSLPTTGDITGYLMSKVVTADDVRPPQSLLHRISGKAELAEILYVLRPVIYAAAMLHWRKQRNSWKPWLVGLSVEYGARQLAKSDYSARLASGIGGMTVLEKDEMRKRGWNMAWWAMRGAFYENVTKSWIHSATSKVSKIPLVGMVANMVEDSQFLWDEYYFPTATL